MSRPLLITLLVALCLPLLLGAAKPKSAEEFVKVLAPLVSPANLAKLKERRAIPRVPKIVYWLETARKAGFKPDNLVDDALARVGMKGEAAAMTRDAVLRNREIAQRLGCLSATAMAELRKGQSPTIRRGPCRGDELTVDHIIPRSVCPESDNVLANLEFMPASLNQQKGAKIGDRQRDLARRLRDARLLSEEGLKKITAHGP